MKSHIELQKYYQDCQVQMYQIARQNMPNTKHHKMPNKPK